MEVLSPEARVLGCLIEKEMTTPEYYPMTINALVAACNQQNNREPVVTFDEEIVERALRSLNDKDGLAKFTRSPGARALKYVHKAREVLEVDDQQTSLLAVLMLRGAQTSGELRTRTERYTDFGDAAEVEAVLRDLIHRDVPLVERLDREPGQREERFRTLLADWEARSSSGPNRPTDIETRLDEVERRLTAIESALGL